MSTDERYEGWTNRETWAVALHINNDQGWQESVHEALRALVEDDPDPEGREDMAYAAGQAIKDNVEDTLVSHIDLLVDGAASYTILSARDDIGSLWRVNWHELGEAFLRDVAEQDEYEQR